MWYKKYKGDLNNLISPLFNHSNAANLNLRSYVKLLSVNSVSGGMKDKVFQFVSSSFFFINNRLSLF